MKNYMELLRDVYENGVPRQDRTGTGTKALFGKKLEFDLREGFPLVTSKYTWFKGVKIELLWMLKGTTSAEYMLEHGVHIWDEWMDEHKDLGRVYGVQWRDWRSEIGSIDQVKEAIETIKNNPHSRRIIVNAWNPGELHKMALPPCHILDQYFVSGEYLDMQCYQRSGDLFLGVPFDIASKALLLSMMAQVTGKKPRMLHYVFGDVHIYNDHKEQTELLLQRAPNPNLPTLVLNKDVKDIDAFIESDIVITNYVHEPSIKAPVSV